MAEEKNYLSEDAMGFGAAPKATGYLSEDAMGFKPKEPGFAARLGQGASRALDSAKTALTDDRNEIAKIAADQARTALPQTALQRKMAEEYQPYVDAANKAEGVVDNVTAWGAAGFKRAGQLLSNPAEAGKMIAEQLPNSLPGLAGGFAGMKAGAALGSIVAPGPGTMVGGVLGGIAGGFAGGYGLEKGAAVQEQVQKEAQKRGIDIQDQAAVAGMVGENYDEIEATAQRKGVGTAGTDAILNVATMGLAGVGGRAITKEAQALHAAVKSGAMDAAKASTRLAALESANAARNTLGAKALRGTGVIGAEMVGEGASEAVGQKYAYGEVDAGQVIDESLMGLGTGGAMALGGKAFNKAAGIVDQDATTKRLEAARAEIEKKLQAIPEHQQPAARAQLNAELNAQMQAEARAAGLMDEEQGQPDVPTGNPSDYRATPAWAKPPEDAATDYGNAGDEIFQSTGTPQRVDPVREAVRQAADAGGSLSAAAGVAMDSGAAPTFMPPEPAAAAPVEDPFERWAQDIDAAQESEQPVQPAADAAPQGPVILGADSVPLNAGGAPFGNKYDAAAAKKMQPLMRVIKVDGGYALAEKTPAQIAAQEKAGQRLAQPRTSAGGEPIPAHAFIASSGGISRAAAPEVGLDQNPRVGNRFLLSSTGMSTEEATQRLIEEGYLGRGAGINDALALIKTSLANPQYTPEGFERIAQAQSEARFNDYLEAHEDAAQNASEDYDPFAPGGDFGLPDGFTPDDLVGEGYTTANPGLQMEVNALMSQLEDMGFDPVDALGDTVSNYANATQDEFNAAARQILQGAIASSSGNGGRAAAQAAPTPAGAGSAAAAQELTEPTQPAAMPVPGNFNGTPSATIGTRMDAVAGPGFGATDLQSALAQIRARKQQTQQPTETPPNATTPINNGTQAAPTTSAQSQAPEQAAPVATTWAAMPAEARQQVAQAAVLNPVQTAKALASGSIEEMPAAVAAKLEPVLAAPALTTYTPAEIEAQQAQQEQAAKAKAASQRAEAQAATAADDRKRIAAASVAAADSFELGQDPMDSITGQGSLLDGDAQSNRPQAQPQQAQAATKNVAPKPTNLQEGIAAAQKKAKAKDDAPPADDLNAMFDELMAETAPQAPAPKAQPKAGANTARKPRTAAQAAGSAVKNTAAALNNAIDGLGALFGAKSGGRMGSGLSFDEGTYAQAKPLFIQAVSNLKEASADIREAMRAVINMVTAKFGRDVTENMKPYIVRFVSDVRDGSISQEELNAPSTDARLERDSNEPATEPAVVPAVPGDAGAVSGNAGRTGGQAAGAAGRGQPGDSGVPAGGTAADGERGDFRVSGGDAAADAARIAAGSDFSERGSDIGVDGVSADPIPTAKVDAAASKPLDRLAKTAQQREAEKVPVKPGDLDNIKATLPYLLEGQQEDVLKTETRFAKPDGYGMLFTNGTGTGKTFTGLGVVKRMQRQGKNSVLIVVPDDKIAADWVESGVPLGLSISKLQDTKSAGSGIVITTYANLGDNDALARRQWDMVVADEAHTLMQSADGAVTGYLANLRAITHHPDGAYQRHTMLNRKDIDALAKLSEQIQANNKILNNTDTVDAMMASVRAENEQLQKEADALAKKLSEASDAVRAEVAGMQGAKRTRLLALSATPFAYEFTVDWANGYLFDYNEGQASGRKEFRGYNQGSNKDRFFMANFGYTMRYNKLTKPDPTKVDTGLLQRNFNAMLRKSGALSSRMLDVPADYDRRFVLVDSGIGNQIDDALNWISEQRRGAEQGNMGYATLADLINEKFDYLSRRYLLEAIKATEVVPIVRQHMAMGRKVVVFHDYKKGGGFNPFNIKVPGKATEGTSAENAQALESLRNAVIEFRAKFKELVEAPLGELDSPIEVFKREFADVLLVNGDEKKAALLERYKRFQDDVSGPQVMLVQSAKNKGWSGHDTTGKHQRVLINLGQPTAPTMAIQQEGRIYRTGQVTDAIMRYLNTGTSWERMTFAQTIAGRASAAENLGMGEQARALKDSFINAFEESDTYAPGHEGEGKGGKERDKMDNATITAFDRAKTYYWGSQKKTSKTKAQEGKDYFATPEPLGLKMAEWLDLRGSESALEPSAGHGAIARWLPETANRTAIEPSNTLRARLALAMDASKDRLIDGTFEDHAIVNKYDGIVMNPPFGVGGKTAIEHLDKASKHLRDGGRIVALIPTGPAADKRFDQWMNGESERPTKPLYIDPNHGSIYKGDTLTITGFGTLRTIVVDKVDGPANGPRYVRDANTSPDGAINITAINKVEPTGPRTETYRASDGIYTVAEIKLPQVTFERAGTAVATRIVILEKQNDASRAPNARAPVDLANITDINKLFDRIENMNVQPRAMTAEQEAAEKASKTSEAKASKADATPATQPKAPKTANPAAVGTVDRGGAKVITHTTGAGKTIHGIVKTDWTLAQARAVDPYTFKKNGGFFIREAYLKPEGDTADISRSFAGQQAATANVGTPAATIRAAITKAYGKLLGQLESKGLVTLTQTEAQAIDAAAQARAKKTGGDVAQIKRSLAAAVQNGVGMDVKRSAAPSQTQTEAFKRWFKDSKAVDADGKPLVVYHGTAADLTFFDPLALGVSTQAKSARGGFFFTSSQKVASGYAHMSETRPGLRNAVYANAAKSDVLTDDLKAMLLEASEKFSPDDSDDSQWINEAGGGVTGANVLPVYLSIQNPMVVDYMGNEYRERSFADVMAQARSQGHDGVVFRNAEDSGHKDYAEVSDIYVAFSPTQIKSAIGNNGNFDPASLDIRRSANGAVQGFFDPQTGQSFLIADNLSAEAAPGVLMHEVGIHMAADGSMKALFNRAALMLKAQKADPFMKAVQAKLDAAGEASSEEVTAYMVEAYENDRAKAPASVKRWLQDLLAAVKAWLHKKGIVGAGSLTVADIAAVARANAKSMARGDVGGGVKFSRTGGADQTMTEAFKRWFGDSKAVDADGKPLAVYHGTNADFSKFDVAKSKRAAFGLGFYFTSAPNSASQLATVDSSIVMPVYLSITNPASILDFYHAMKEVNSDQFSSDRQVDSGAEITKNLISKGFDGVIIGDDFVVFHPEQIKSATGNNGNFDPANPDIRFSRASQAISNAVNERKTVIAGQTSRAYTPQQQAAMQNVGFQVEQPSLKERAQALWQDAGKKLAQGIVDQFAPVKEISKDAYALLRLSKGASGAFETLLKGGKLKLSGGVYDFDEANKGGVVDALLTPLNGEHHDFLRWVAANRAERLMGEDRERLFTPDDIAALKTLADGQLSYDFTLKNGPRKGQITRSRAEAYKDSLATFNAFNKNVLDMAEQSGLIDKDSRATWESEFYVPFYRVADEESGGVRGMNIKGSVVRQQAFKHLKGGKQALNNDLLDNTLMNWAHLLDASAKNRAAKATLEAAQQVGVAIEAPKGTLDNIASAIGKKNGIVWFMDGGQKRHFMVDDPYIMTAISSLEYAGMNSPIMNAMSAFKHALTIGVTASPFFKIRNLIRDSVQVVGTSSIGVNPLKNVAEGWKLTDPKNDAYFRLLAGGGTIHFGAMLEGSEAKRVQALVESGVKDSTILNTDHKVKQFYRKYIEPGITAYNELGNRGEAVNRAALYDQLRKQGMGHAEASLQARDLMDFSMQGSFTSIRFLSQVVPFLNARLQGMYKLGRAANENPKRMAYVTGAVAMASLALLAAYGDDDDWKRREDWDRNNFWWFKVGGVAFRIPKPFELGAIGTLAERGAEYLMDDEMTGKRFRGQVLKLLGDNLSMNPIPQAVKPLLDVYANKDSFRNAPIESMGMERMKSEYRFNDRTSMVARGLSTAANSVTGLVGAESLSPVQIDHLLRGYFGWLGTFAVGTADMIARPVTNQPTQATQDIWKKVTGGIVSELQDAPSRYVSSVYDQAKELEQAFGTWRALQKSGKPEEAAAFFADNREEIARYRSVTQVKSAESKLNERIRQIERNEAMDGDQKREEIRRIRAMKEALAKSLAPA